MCPELLPLAHWDCPPAPGAAPMVCNQVFGLKQSVPLPEGSGLHSTVHVLCPTPHSMSPSNSHTAGCALLFLLCISVPHNAAAKSSADLQKGPSCAPGCRSPAQGHRLTACLLWRPQWGRARSPRAWLWGCVSIWWSPAPIAPGSGPGSAGIGGWGWLPVTGQNPSVWDFRREVTTILVLLGSALPCLLTGWKLRQDRQVAR